jgi:NMD protein affecting ribosome stability and mRNA decay
MSIELRLDPATTVPCKLCGEPTTMLGTKLCDNCWELEHRIQSSPKIARIILNALERREE